MEADHNTKGPTMISDRITYTVTTYSNGDKQLIVSGPRLALEDLADKIAELNAEYRAEEEDAIDRASEAMDMADRLPGPHDWEGRYYEEYEPSPYDGTYSEE